MRDINKRKNKALTVNCLTLETDFLNCCYFFRICCYAADMLLGLLCCSDMLLDCYAVMLFLNLSSIF